MKILFVGDKRHIHNCLAEALRRMGHTVTVASTESFGQLSADDINLRTAAQGPLRPIVLLGRLLFALPRMRGYDVVEIAGPNFLALPPAILMKAYKFLRRHNKKVFLSALDTDYYYVKTCYEGMQLRYNEYFYRNNLTAYSLNHKKTTQAWLSSPMKKLAGQIARSVNGIVACMPEYYAAYVPLYPTKTFSIDLPADTHSIQPDFIDKEPDKVRFFIQLQKSEQARKGSDLLLEAAKSVCASHPDKTELIVKEKLTYAEYCSCLKSAHVLLDQVYSLTPSPDALLAMTHGRIAVSGAEPEYYDFINEPANHPIVNVLPDPADITKKLEWLVTHKSILPELSKNSRKFVEKHNDSEIIAQKYLDIWQKI